MALLPIWQHACYSTTVSSLPHCGPCVAVDAAHSLPPVLEQQTCGSGAALLAPGVAWGNTRRSNRGPCGMSSMLSGNLLD